MATDLELVTTEDIVKELARRYDALALAAYKFTDTSLHGTPDDDSVFMVLYGAPVTCYGLAELLSNKGLTILGHYAERHED